MLTEVQQRTQYLIAINLVNEAREKGEAVTRVDRCRVTGTRTTTVARLLNGRVAVEEITMETVDAYGRPCGTR